MAQIKGSVVQTIVQKGSFTLNDSKKILGYGRKRGMPVLEYLDETGLTHRVGNERRLQNRKEEK